MRPLEDPDRICISFDDHRLVANAGLILPVALARHLDLGGALGRANAGDKMMTLVVSALIGGDCIDDTDALRAGGTARVPGCVVKAPSTLGTFLRSFRWGHVRQLDLVSRELQAWAAGAGPGDGPLTIDLDSTICETYGLGKEGARHHGYTEQRGYHPCAHCRSLPDGGAGNRPTTLSLIHQPVEDLSNSRRTHRPARVPGCLRPLHTRLTQPTTGPLLVPSTRSRPARSRLHPCQVPFRCPHSRFGGFGLGFGSTSAAMTIGQYLTPCLHTVLRLTPD